MEERKDYLHRFMHDPVMVDIFASNLQRCDLAERTFAAKWTEASVRVTKANGDQFFID